MENRLERYENDPNIGPLIAQYRVSTHTLNRLKDRLRSPDNIDAIMEASARQVAIRNRLKQLIGVREKQRREEQLRVAWVAAAIALSMVGFANLGIHFGWW